MMRLTKIAFAAALGTAALCAPAFAQAQQDPAAAAPGTPEGAAGAGAYGNTQSTMQGPAKKTHKHQTASNAQTSNNQGSKSQTNQSSQDPANSPQQSAPDAAAPAQGQQ